VAALVAVLLAFAFLSQQAQAQSVSVSGQTTLNGVTKEAPSHTANAGSVNTSLTSSEAANNRFLEADLSASASIGSLHTFAHASSYNTVSNGFSGFSDAGDADTTASFQDLLTVSSASLPVGTSCTIEFSMPVDGTLSTNNGLQSIADVAASFSVSDLNGHTQTTSYNEEEKNGVITGGGSNPPFSFSAVVGEVLQINGSLQSIAGAADNLANPTGEATSDYSNTAHYYADPVTPGVTLVSASGHDYSAPAPVPEASTTVSLGALLGLGGLALAVRARRRSRA